MKRSLILTLAALVLFAPAGRAAAAGVVTGTITGPDGAPLRAIFVHTEHQQTRMTTMVLSNNQGRYRIDNLTPGTYQIWATAVGFRGTPTRLTGVSIQDGKPMTADFAMRAVPVQWNELTRSQASVLLPEGKGRETFLTNCGNCHGMSVITGRRDHAGWLDAIDGMRRRGVTTIRPQIAEEVAAYLAEVLGPDSKTPVSPADLPGWEKVKPQWSDESLNIVYVDYPVNQGTNRPGTGYPDKAGNVWMEIQNGVARLNPATGEVTAWRMREGEGGGVHDVLPLPDGSVWLTVTAQQDPRNRLGRFNARTQEIEVFKDPNVMPPVPQVDGITPIWGSPRVSGVSAGMRRHTPVQDYQGNIWSSGRPLTKYDVKTKTFTVIKEAPDTYGLAIDAAGRTVWFAEFNPAEYSSLGKVDVATGKVTKYKPPLVDGVDGRPRRVKIDSAGNIWFAQYYAGSIGKFDPRAERFTSYKLPGLYPTVYGFGIDTKGHIWGVSHWNEATYRLDPATGKVVMYPSPYTDRSTRDLWTDAQGRMWYGAQVYYKIGHFSVREPQSAGTR